MRREYSPNTDSNPESTKCYSKLKVELVLSVYNPESPASVSTTTTERVWSGVFSAEDAMGLCLQEVRMMTLESFEEPPTTWITRPLYERWENEGPSEE
jgi:hypothetical protein